MALVMAATAVIGFTQTFWMPLSQGVPEHIPVIAVHAASSFGWMALLVYQTWLAANGQIARHRGAGMAGIALASTMIIFGILAAINSARRAAAAGFADQGEAFMILPLLALFLFTVLLVAALANRNRSDWHKRLMLAATAVLLEAAIARPYIVFFLMGGNPPPFAGNVGLAGWPGPPPPVSALLQPSLASLLFIVAGLVHDRRSIGRLHPANQWALGLAISAHLAKIPLSETEAWHSIARFLVNLAN